MALLEQSPEMAIAELAGVLRVVARSAALCGNAAAMEDCVTRCDRVIESMKERLDGE